MTYRRDFHEVRKKSEVENNLTELNVYAELERMHVDHPDWVAHLARYSHAFKRIHKEQPSSILDVGCGRLNLAQYLWRNRSDFHGTYTGIDLRATAYWLEGIKFKADMDLYRMDITEDPVETILPHDVVVSFETFEHVPRSRQQEFLNRLYKWTRPGGFCLFSTPNAGVSKSTAENHIGSDGISRERTYDEKIRMAMKAGFVEVKAFGTFAATTRLPKEFMEQPYMQIAREYFTASFLQVFAATAFPELSNNALFELKKPGWAKD